MANDKPKIYDMEALHAAINYTALSPPVAPNADIVADALAMSVAEFDAIFLRPASIAMKARRGE